MSRIAVNEEQDNGSYNRSFTLKNIGEVQVKIPRSQVHVARNVLTKVPKKFKDEAASDLRSIFYAASRQTADECF